MSVEQYISGSKAFFGDYKDYVLHDLDYVIIDPNSQSDFTCTYYKDVTLDIGVDVFKWHRHLPRWYIEYIKNPKNDSQNIAMILTPYVAKDLGITIDDIKELKDVFDRLHDDYDGKYDYYRIIWESYIENNDFTLTEEQRLKAYIEYKKKRDVR